MRKVLWRQLTLAADMIGVSLCYRKTPQLERVSYAAFSVRVFTQAQGDSRDSA
jgi:hypothetical protein